MANSFSCDIQLLYKKGYTDSIILYKSLVYKCRFPLLPYFSVNLKILYDCSPPGSSLGKNSLGKRFSRQEYCSELPCPPAGDLLDPGIETASLMSPALAGRFFITSVIWEVRMRCHNVSINLKYLIFTKVFTMILYLPTLMKEAYA